jgi:hypothetical protein
MNVDRAAAASRWMRIGRTSALASVLILIGSSAYAALSLGGGEVRHEQDPNDPSIRYTTVGFRTWSSIVPAPDFPEIAYREVRASNGEWIRDGFYDRRMRSGFVVEDGNFRNGLREGTWRFWTANGRIDAERSGLYVDDRRVAPDTNR